jgi:hypothetical protein
MTTPEEPTGQAPEKPKRSTRKQPPKPPIDPQVLAADVSAPSRKTKREEIEEPKEERDSRLRIDEENAKADREEKKAAMDHRRRIEIIALVAYLVFSGIASIPSIWVLLDKKTAPQDKAWAAPLLTLIIGGIAGFLTGRSSSRTSEK